MRQTSSTSAKFLVLLSHIGALLVVIFWGTSFLSTKVLMEDGGFTPVEVFVYRFTGAYILLLIFTFRKIFSNSIRDELTFVIGGICSGSLYFITENYALKLTSAGNVSLLASIAPLFTTFLMAYVYKQRLKAGVLIGSAIALSGVACIIFANGVSLEFNPLGDCLALSAAICWSIYTISVRRLIPNYTSLFITRKLFFYGVLTALPLLLVQKEPTHLQLLFNLSEPKYILNFLYLVILCSVVGYLIWNEAMKYLGAVKANNYLYLQPPITMVAGYFLLHESIYILGIIGCILVISGLIISDKWKGSIFFFKK